MPKLLRAKAASDAVEDRQIRRLAQSRHAPGDWILRARMIARSWGGRCLLAQSPSRLVAPVSARGLRWPDLRRRRGDRQHHHPRHPEAQSSSETLDLGSPSPTTPSASSPFGVLPLRNGALVRVRRMGGVGQPNTFPGGCPRYSIASTATLAGPPLPRERGGPGNQTGFKVPSRICIITNESAYGLFV